MDYQLENLGPEGFQYLAQTLVTKMYPNVQCFPVAQPDGGRDITALRHHYASIVDEEVLVFQVKFSRNPTAIDQHKWLEGILKEEAPKIKKLLPKGVKEFVLATNIPGTAHPDTGSIDRVDALLKKYMPCPASVWWRNDINRRLDDSWNIKWSYPQIMSGPDVMRSLIENGLGEHKERRITAIISFLLDQYFAEEEVKFKQVELQNKLLDLFIDVPIAGGIPNAWGMYFDGRSDGGSGSGGRPRFISEDEGLSDSEVGAATAILSGALHQLRNSVVLEGAPGQGKSTITQYVAQVYRMRLLHKEDELSKI